jgi:hypothetical protein
MGLNTDNSSKRSPHLSVVAVSRNDDHGGDLAGRMQHFVNGFIEQCRRHQLAAELILVEWNPPADRRPLETMLQWPAGCGLATVRIVTVPSGIHRMLPNSDVLPLFQMIGKNVGIRRARGQYVLATNIDILFDDALMRHMRDRLNPGHVLRVDRYDVPNDLPRGECFEHVLDACASRFFQVNTRFGVFDVQRKRLLGTGASVEAALLSAFYRLRLLGPGLPAKSDFESLSTILRRLVRIPTIRLDVPALAKAAAKTAKNVVRKTFWWIGLFVRRTWPPHKIPARLHRFSRIVFASIVRTSRRTWRGSAELAYRLRDYLPPSSYLTRLLRPEPASARRLRTSRWLHTNACGDFTLLAREDWFRLRGYPEWPIFSWHLDSAMLYAANAQGIRHITLGPKYRIYHIDHSFGWSHAEGARLFERLDAKGIPYLDNKGLHRLQVRYAEDPDSAIVNHDNWGLGDDVLPERQVWPIGAECAKSTYHPRN